MAESVFHERVALGGGVIALIAGVRTFSGVHAHVARQRRRLRSPVGAQVAGVRPFAGVSTHVPHDAVVLGRAVRTHLTLETRVSGVLTNVLGVQLTRR